MARHGEQGAACAPAQAKPCRQPRSYTKLTMGDWKMEVPPQKRCLYAVCCTPLVRVRSAKVGFNSNCRWQRGQRQSPDGEPPTDCRRSGVVWQMGQASSNVT